jgi:hypothetical protein
MIKLLAAILVMPLVSSCGDSSGSDPRDAVVTGSWLMTFSPTGPCQLSPISFTLSESPSGAPLGNHGAYAIACVGVPDDSYNSGPVETWFVNGDTASLYVTDVKHLTGVVAGSSWSGTFFWTGLEGNFTAVRQ